MTGGMTVSLGLTVGVVLLALILLFINARKKTRLRSNVAGVDALAMLFAEKCHRLVAPVAAFIGWMLLSIAISLLPLFNGRGTYVLDRVQALILFNYCILVPVLVGIYILLIQSLGHFELMKPAVGRTKVTGTRRFWLFQLSLLVATLAVQMLAMHSELERPSPCSPWVMSDDIWKSVAGPHAESRVWRCEEAASPRAEELTFAGVFYYALRGLDTFMALGLMTTIFSTWAGMRRRFRRQQLVDDRYPGPGPNEAVQRVGAALLGSIVFGSSITTIHGISLAAHASRMRDIDDKLALFTESTWAYWAVATFVITVVAAACIAWLRRAILRQLRARELAEQALVRRFELSSASGPEGATPDSADYTETVLGLRASIAAKYKDIQALPLPPGAFPALGFATLAQIGNVVLALYAFGLGRPLFTG